VNRNGFGLNFLARWAQSHARGLSVSGEETAGVSDGDRLMTLEETSRLATLYMWLAQRFPRTYSNARGIERVRENADELIRQALLNRGRASNRRKAQRRHRTKVDLA
jgi:hypothetical protein